MAAYLTSTTEGKIHFGLNIYPSTPPSTSSGSAQGRWNALKKALEIKKHLKAFGRSARVVNKDGNNLSTATTFHEKLVQK